MNTVHFARTLFIQGFILLFSFQLHAQPDSSCINKSLITLEYPVTDFENTRSFQDKLRDHSVIEIRSYNIVPGRREKFHQVVIESVLPLFEEFETNLVAFGPSLHDENSYFLMRSYGSLTERRIEQDKFYKSDQWRVSARESILSMIDSYTTIVLNAQPETSTFIHQNDCFENSQN